MKGKVSGRRRADHMAPKLYEKPASYSALLKRFVGVFNHDLALPCQRHPPLHGASGNGAIHRCLPPSLGISLLQPEHHGQRHIPESPASERENSACPGQVAQLLSKNEFIAESN